MWENSHRCRFLIKFLCYVDNCFSFRQREYIFRSVEGVRFRGMPVDTCFHHVVTPDRLSWSEARDVCKRRGYDLLRIQDGEQMRHLHRCLLYTTFTEDDRLVYIGKIEGIFSPLHALYTKGVFRNLLIILGTTPGIV